MQPGTGRHQARTRRRTCLKFHAALCLFQKTSPAYAAQLLCLQVYSGQTLKGGTLAEAQVPEGARIAALRRRPAAAPHKPDVGEDGPTVDADAVPTRVGVDACIAGIVLRHGRQDRGCSSQVLPCGSCACPGLPQVNKVRSTLEMIIPMLNSMPFWAAQAAIDEVTQAEAERRGNPDTAQRPAPPVGHGRSMEDQLMNLLQGRSTLCSFPGVLLGSVLHCTCVHVHALLGCAPQAIACGHACAHGMHEAIHTARAFFAPCRLCAGRATGGDYGAV